jgi:hypothetical protein
MTRQHASAYAPPEDIYAHRRCRCGHILYADQKPGDRCLFCTCPDHRPRVSGLLPIEGGEES